MLVGMHILTETVKEAKVYKIWLRQSHKVVKHTEPWSWLETNRADPWIPNLLFFTEDVGY